MKNIVLILSVALVIILSSSIFATQTSSVKEIVISKSMIDILKSYAKQDSSSSDIAMKNKVDNVCKMLKLPGHLIKVKISKQYTLDFCKLLDSKDQKLNEIALRGLVILKDSESINALLKHLRSRNFNVMQKNFYEEIDRKNEKQETKGIREKADTYFGYIESVASAIMLLGEIGDDSVIPYLGFAHK